MHFGLDVPTTGEYADPRVLANLAADAEAAGWDGACVMFVNAETRQWLSLEDFRACVSYVQSQRGQHTPFEVIMSGDTSGDRQEAMAKVQAFHEAGATWWVEEGLGWSLEEFSDHIRTGPPRG